MKKRELIEQLVKDGIIHKRDSGWYRPLTRDAMAQAIVELLGNNFSTTTLDVKLYLRNKGYWAIQEDVSKWMDTFYKVGILAFIDNGTYRKYFLSDRTELQYE